MSVAAQGLPIEVKELIERKIRHRRGELERRWAGSTPVIYSKLRADIMECIHARRLRRVFTTAPLAAYKTLVANANDLTTEWPSTVWDSITSVLAKAGAPCAGRDELNAMVDKFAWAIDAPPFTLDYINAEHLREMVARQASSYGLAPFPPDASVNRQWNIDESLAKALLVNNARRAREGVSIAIDEYLVGQRVVDFSVPNSRYTRNTVRREARKLNTAAMYAQWQKEYRALQKKRPNMTDVWYSQQIAKLKMAQGREAETIRKNMKK